MAIWKVVFTSKAEKQARKLLAREQDGLKRLLKDLQSSGPVQYQWRNYSRLGKGQHHCHLGYKWIACWREGGGGDIEVIEIYYVGSRENAPY